MGTFYNPGDEWDPHPCAHCVCNNLHSECSFKTCPTCDGEEGVAAMDQCCAPCDGQDVEPLETEFCSWRGQRYANSQRWTLGPCIDCTCESGVGECQVRSCLPEKCGHPVAVEGECCMKCPGEGGNSRRM